MHNVTSQVTSQCRLRCIPFILSVFLFATPVAKAQNCTFTLSQNGYQLTGAGGSFSFSFNATPSTCSWTATSNVTWVTLTSPRSGIGPATVELVAAANNSSLRRSGSIILQSGASSIAFPIVQNS